MMITRVQALVIALGLALVGVAAARGDMAIFRSSAASRIEAGRALAPEADLRLGITRDSMGTETASPPRL
jgi:hypothetical protein